MTILVISPGETSSFRVYVDQIGTANITSATVGAVTGLTFGSVTTDNATTPKSIIVPVTAAADTHGKLFQAIVTCLLASGGTLPRPITIRCSASLG